MSNISDDFINIIHDLIQQELAQRSSVVLCQIKEKKDNDHYDLVLESDPNNYIHNVTNMTKFDLSVGDYVYIFKINGQLNNAFICYKTIPYIAEEITSGGGSFITPEYIINFIMNKGHLNKNVTVDVLIKEFNTNAINKNFLTSETQFNDSQARPYYQSWYGTPYWMFGKAKGTQSNIGRFGLELSQVRISGGSFELSNGFTLNNTQKKVASNVPEYTLKIIVTDINGNVKIIEKSIAAIQQGTDPEDITKYTIDFATDGSTPIKYIDFSANINNGRFNLFITNFMYKLG